MRDYRRHLIEAAISFLVFCAISSLSFFAPIALPLMVLSDIVLPLTWGWRTGAWVPMGFTRRNAGSAIHWGLVAGVATGLLGFVALPERSLPPNLGLELAVGVPLWLLVASPFQEFFFRGWLQSRLEDGLGKAAGLLAATFGAGLIYGYSFQRTGSILTPWIAHSLSGIALLLMGAASFVGLLP